MKRHYLKKSATLILISILILSLVSCNNLNFKSYILTGKEHHTKIADFDKNTQTKIIETIKYWLD